MSDKPIVNLVWAMAQNGVIGRDNQLPWRLPNDLAYFKQVTMGHPIIMGRKTFDSIGRPLPGRRNIVVTRQEGWTKDDVDVAHSVEAAVEIGRESHATELMVIGGAEIYRQSLPFADGLYVTLVHDEVAGDAYFPEVDWSAWEEMTREDYKADDVNPYDYSFVQFRRKY